MRLGKRMDLGRALTGLAAAPSFLEAMAVVVVAWWVQPASAPKECLMPAREMDLEACTEHSARGSLLEDAQEGPVGTQRRHLCQPGQGRSRKAS